MALTIVDRGKRNEVAISAEDLAQASGTLTFTGDDARVSIGRLRGIRGKLNLNVGNGAAITIGENCLLGQLFVFAVNGASLSIGKATNFNGACEIFQHEPTTLIIGSRCLIAGGVRMMTSDMHSITDLQGNRINPPADIAIGEHVWVGARSSILKGATIGNNSIVAYGSIVTGRFGEHCVIGGNPARVLKTDVNWDGRLLPLQEPSAPRT